MAEGNGGCGVKSSGSGRVRARLAKLYTLFRLCIRVPSGGEVGCRGQESGKHDMLHHGSVRPLGKGKMARTAIELGRVVHRGVTWR
jgi:hypothetical protein